MKLLKKDSLKETFELVGIFAVVVSLLIVAYEVRQSNRIAQATTTYEIGRDVNEFNIMGYTDPQFAEFLLSLADEDAERSAVQNLQIRLLATRFLNLWTVQEKAYQNGLLTEAQFEMTKADVHTVMNAFPVLVNHWAWVLKEQPGLEEFETMAPIIEATKSQQP